MKKGFKKAEKFIEKPQIINIQANDFMGVKRKHLSKS